MARRSALPGTASRGDLAREPFDLALEDGLPLLIPARALELHPFAVLVELDNRPLGRDRLAGKDRRQEAEVARNPHSPPRCVSWLPTSKPGTMRRPKREWLA